MNIKLCEKCGAKWLDGELFWFTGKSGTDEDLDGLVCNNLKPGEEELCVNDKKGDTTGQTWEYRRGYVAGLMDEAMRKQNKDLL